LKDFTDISPFFNKSQIKGLVPPVFRQHFQKLNLQSAKAGKSKLSVDKHQKSVTILS
jgi:hypothetical protein